MPAANRVAILLDGGFVKKQLENSLGHFPSPGEVSDVCTKVMGHPDFAGMDLFRAYYYDADPYTGKATNPLDGTVTNFSITAPYKRNDAFIKSLEHQPNFAVRRGTLVFRGWILGKKALKRLVSTVVLVSGDSDMVPAMKLARREGLRIYLDTLGQTSIRQELKVHADVVL